jgi:cephalosporin hydroxylase
MDISSRFKELITRLHKPGACVVKPRLGKEFEIDNWVLSDFINKRLVPIVGLTPFPLNELMLMTGAVCWLEPSHIFEWGTHIGKSARILYETCRHFNISAEIHSIDLPPEVKHIEHPGRKRGRLVKGFKGVHLYEGDGLTTSSSILKAVGPSVKRVLFFLDGDHAYETVSKELAGIYTNCQGASILVHDTFYQSPDSGYNVGPYRAVQEHYSRHPGYYNVLVQELGLPGMTLLLRSEDQPIVQSRLP